MVGKRNRICKYSPRFRMAKMGNVKQKGRDSSVGSVWARRALIKNSVVGVAASVGSLNVNVSTNRRLN